MANITIEPATVERLADVQHTFSGGGDGASCQCQWWMLPNREWEATSRDDKQRLLEQEIAAGPPPGLIAYVDGEAAAWVRVSPRIGQRRIARTRAIVSATAEPLDAEDVWSISCFVTRKEHRGIGLNAALLDAAVDLARTAGARVIEAHPLDPSAKKIPTNDLYRGVLSTFLDAGFEIVARPQPHSAVVSLTLGDRVG